MSTTVQYLHRQRARRRGSGREGPGADVIAAGTAWTAAEEADADDVAAAGVLPTLRRSNLPLTSGSRIRAIWVRHNRELNQEQKTWNKEGTELAVEDVALEEAAAAGEEPADLGEQAGQSRRCSDSQMLCQALIGACARRRGGLCHQAGPAQDWRAEQYVTERSRLPKNPTRHIRCWVRAPKGSN
jgi:hypothetical protein